MAKYLKIFINLLVYFNLLQTCAVAQYISSKMGGVCFRVDDVQLLVNWQQYSSIFNKYGEQFSFALNLNLISDPNYFAFIRQLQSQGYEFMDHTPNHLTSLITDQDTGLYINDPDVDHISGDTIYLKHLAIGSNTNYVGEGICNINNDTVICTSAGGFNGFSTNGNLWIGLYFPSINKYATVSEVLGYNSNNIDTLILSSFWGETINLGTYSNIPYHIISQYDVDMTAGAKKILVNKTLALAQQYNIDRPYTWVQPGGRWAVFSSDNQKSFLSPNGYTAGTGLPDQSLKCFNEYNPNGDRRFGMQWGDFLEDETSFVQVKNIIADRSARHFYSVGHSHFSSLLGGWSGYLVRMDSLLSWLKQKQIPVVTYSQMANKLYSDSTNPYENIFPSLNTDLDGDGRPDGYYYAPGSSYGVLDTLDGYNNQYSLSINRNGTICTINQLGGLEKGANDFYFYTKGTLGSTIQVNFYIYFPSGGYKLISYEFAAGTPNWFKNDIAQSINGNTQLIIPDSASYATITISCTNYLGGAVKISGMTLMKQSTANINAPWNLNEDADTVDYVYLRWTNNAGNATGFSIERKIDSTGTFSIVGNTGQNVTTYADNAVKSLLTYGQHNLYYRVRAYDNTDTSVYSNLITIQRIVSNPTIRGKILYANSTKSAFSGLTLTLQELATGKLFAATSNDTGYYQTQGIDTGKYVIGVQNFNDWEGVDATDAMLIARYFLGIQPFNPLQLSAADVNNDGLINDTDAILVLKRFVGIINSFPNNKPNVVFQPVNSGYTVNVTNNGLSLNINCLYTGDVREAYIPLVPLSKARKNLVTLNYNPSIKIQSDNNVIEVPFILNSDLAPGAISLKIVYKKNYLTFTGIVLNEKINSAMYNQTGDTIIIGWFNAAGNKDGIIFNKGDELLTLKFQVNMSWSPDDKSVFAVLPGSEIADYNGNVINNLLLDVPVGSNIQPNSYSLEQNYPNPFNNSTIIKYAIPFSSNVKVSVYNLLGQMVKQLVSQEQHPGFYSISMDDTNLSSGVYIYNIEATGIKSSAVFRQSKKMILLK
jgi:hypothetical protein